MSCLCLSAIPLPLLQLCLRPIPRRSFLFQKQTPCFCQSGNFLKNLPYRLYFLQKSVYSIWFTFCLVPLLEQPFEKALKNFSVVCIPAAPDSASQPEILLQAFPKLISPILLLLFPCRRFFFPTGTFLSPFYRAPVSETAAELSASPEE